MIKHTIKIRRKYKPHMRGKKGISSKKGSQGQGISNKGIRIYYVQEQQA